jgi:hypothetical protein
MAVTKLTSLKRTDASASKQKDVKVQKSKKTRTTVSLDDDVTKWLQIQGINNKTNMSLEIEKLARAAMEK